MFCRFFGLWVAMAGECMLWGMVWANFFQVSADWVGPCFVALGMECFPGMLWGKKVWAFFCYRCRLTGPCNVLSMFWPLGGAGRGTLSRHLLGMVWAICSRCRPGPCFVHVLASGWRWLGNVLQACFWRWFGRLFPGVGWLGRAMFCQYFGHWVAFLGEC